MRIGVISQWFPPEPAFIPASLAAELAARGHEVRVLTGYPNYPQGTLYPGYRQRWRQESFHGSAVVRRVPLYPSHDGSAVRRSANYLSFAATSSVSALRFLRQVDVLYVYHPPPTAYAAAALLRLVRGIPAVLHVQDLWPDAVVESPMGGRAAGVLHRVIGPAMRRLYRAAAGIVVI